MTDSTPYTTRYIGLASVFKYYIEGAQLAFAPGVRKFIFVPIIANVALIALAVVLFFFIVSGWLSNLMLGLDSAIFGFLAYFISCVMSSFVIFAMIYYFSTLAVIIAAPFYGFLAQKVEHIKGGVALPDEAFTAVIRDVPRIMRREMEKQCFFLPWALLCLIVTLLPALNIIAPLMWVALTSYMGTIQFTDYGFDNHKVPFKTMKRILNENKVCTLTFGFIVVIGLTIPIVNLVLPVIAVCAATLYFMDMYQGQPRPAGADQGAGTAFREEIAGGGPMTPAPGPDVPQHRGPQDQG